MAVVFVLMALVFTCLADTMKSTLKPRSAMSQHVFDELIYYGRYCATYPKAPCQQPPTDSVVEGYANAKPTTAMTLFRSDSDKELIMTFPGTKSLPDFLTDLNTQLVDYTSDECRNCHVHAGVWKAWRSIEAPAIQVLDTALARYPDYKIKLAGHSLGAALVKFAYVTLSARGYNISAAYSYGEFRVGDAQFSDYVDRLAGATEDYAGNYYRVTHADDGVPQTVSPKLGFRHSRTEFWFEQGSNISSSYQCYGQEPTDCNNSEPGIGLFGINAAHVFYPGINVTGCGGFGLGL